MILPTDLPGEVREVLEADRVDVFDISPSTGGAVAALWAACSGVTGAHLEGCRSALVIADGDEVNGVALGGDPRFITRVPAGWLVAEEDGPVRIDTAGLRQPIYSPAGNTAAPEPGDTALPPLYGSTALRGDKLVPLPSPPGRVISSAYVTPSGRLVAVTSAGAGIAVSATDDGLTWVSRLSTRATVPVTAVMTGTGDHVALIVFGDAPDGSIPLVEVQVSHDAGRTWTWTSGLDTDGGDSVRDLSSMAVTPDGSTYLTTGSHGLIRIDAAGNALASRLSSHDHSAFVLDESVCLVAEAGAVDELRCSADDGTTWVPQPFPGFR